MTEHVVEQRQDDEGSIVCHCLRFVPVGRITGVGNDRLDREHTIPQPGVMGADIADVVQRLQPRKQHRASEVVSPRDSFLDPVSTHRKQCEHRSKRHRFSGSPNRQVWEFVVRRFEMFDELFSAALSLNPQFVHKSGVALWIRSWEMPGVQMRERPMQHGQFCDEDCSNRDLYPLDSVHDGESKLTVKHIVLPAYLKGCAWDKRAAGLLKWCQ